MPPTIPWRMDLWISKTGLDMHLKIEMPNEGPNPSPAGRGPHSSGRPARSLGRRTRTGPRGTRRDAAIRHRNRSRTDPPPEAPGTCPAPTRYCCRPKRTPLVSQASPQPSGFWRSPPFSSSSPSSRARASLLRERRLGRHMRRGRHRDAGADEKHSGHEQHLRHHPEATGPRGGRRPDEGKDPK